MQQQLMCNNQQPQRIDNATNNLRFQQLLKMQQFLQLQQQQISNQQRHSPNNGGGSNDSTGDGTNRSRSNEGCLQGRTIRVFVLNQE